MTAPGGWLAAGPNPSPEARQRIMGAIAQDAAALGGRIGQLPSVIASYSLRPLPADAAQIASARVEAGLPPEGFDYPRAKGWFRAVIPLGLLAIVLELVAGIGGLIDLAGAHVMSTGVGVTLAIVGAASAVGAVGSAVVVRGDKLRLHNTHRRAITRSRSWHSEQPWLGAAYSGPERHLVNVAAASVGRIVATPAWSDPRSQHYWVRPDLSAELQDIDEQAYRIAVARTAGGEAGAHVDAAWAAALDRVAALQDYETAMTAVRIPPPPEQPAIVLGAVAALTSGTARDEFAQQQMQQLVADVPMPDPSPPVPVAPPQAFASPPPYPAQPYAAQAGPPQVQPAQQPTAQPPQAQPPQVQPPPQALAQPPLAQPAQQPTAQPDTAATPTPMAPPAAPPWPQATPVAQPDPPQGTGMPTYNPPQP